MFRAMRRKERQLSSEETQKILYRNDHDIVLEELSTNFASVVIFGRARILEEPKEKAQAMAKMMGVLGSGTTYAVSHGCVATDYVMVEITPEHITGKARNGF